LADERWKLINRYMGRSDESAQPMEETVPADEKSANVPLLPVAADTSEVTQQEAVETQEHARLAELPSTASAELRHGPGGVHDEPVHSQEAREEPKPADGSRTDAGALRLSPGPVGPHEVGKAFQTLAEIDRLCAQIGRLDARSTRMRAFMAAASARLSMR
jgi:hypothetical protein